MSTSARSESATRQPLLAKVHIGRKELGLENTDYRALLERVTSHTSSANCTDAQLEAVIAEMRRLGWQTKPAGRPSAKPHVRKIYALWAAMGPMLECGGTRKSLRAYVTRQTGATAPEFLDANQANLVIEGLKGWQARLQAGGR